MSLNFLSFHRILGEVTPERVEIARQADHIFISMIREAGLYETISQAYAAVDPSKAVGVMGDDRVYAEMIILRAVQTSDCKLVFVKCFHYMSEPNQVRFFFSFFWQL